MIICPPDCKFRTPECHCTCEKYKKGLEIYKQKSEYIKGDKDLYLACREVGEIVRKIHFRR